MTKKREARQKQTFARLLFFVYLLYEVVWCINVLCLLFPGFK